MPGAACGAVNRCLARLVDPVVRRVLAEATLTRKQRRTAGEPSRVTAELELPFPLAEVQDGWIEVVADHAGPCAAPRATGSGAPCAGPIPPSGPNGRRLDWPRTPPPRSGPRWPPRPGSTAGVTGRPPGDACNAALATQRQASLDSEPCAPHPSGDPAYLAEVLGR